MRVKGLECVTFGAYQMHLNNQLYNNYQVFRKVNMLISYLWSVNWHMPRFK
jgi:hypothetical protein